METVGTRRALIRIPLVQFVTWCMLGRRCLNGPCQTLRERSTSTVLVVHLRHCEGKLGKRDYCILLEPLHATQP